MVSTSYKLYKQNPGNISKASSHIGKMFQNSVRENISDLATNNILNELDSC